MRRPDRAIAGVLAALRRFAHARAGLAAVEFALILPMMVMVLFGAVEVVNLLEADRRLENTAASVSDVLSRDNSVDNTEMNGVMSAIDPLMWPDSGSHVDLRICSIIINSTSDARVVWCDTRGSEYPPLAANAVVGGLPTAMMRAGTSLIRVEAAYPYHPRFGFFLLDERRHMDRDTRERNLKHTVYRRSRLVDPIPRVRN